MKHQALLTIQAKFKLAKTEAEEPNLVSYIKRDITKGAFPWGDTDPDL